MFVIIDLILGSNYCMEADVNEEEITELSVTNANSELNKKYDQQCC